MIKRKRNQERGFHTRKLSMVCSKAQPNWGGGGLTRTVKLNPNMVFWLLEVVFGFFSTSLLVAGSQTVTVNKWGALYDIQSLKIRRFSGRTIPKPSQCSTILSLLWTTGVAGTACRHFSSLLLIFYTVYMHCVRVFDINLAFWGGFLEAGRLCRPGQDSQGEENVRLSGKYI